MSTTVDQRVVEMRFDNQQFERNVQTSVSTLEKLKQSLNLTGAAKGLESVGNAAKGINLSGLSGAAETVGLKFNAMYTIADQALRNITNSAYHYGERIVKALTIDPIKTGFQEYETQINAVQTILANTESKGTTLTDVNSALDELNAYADKTIYNFTQMTKNIGTFTAAGVDLDTSVSAIQGIANLAAVSGSTSQQASTAMYQLSQALAAGRVSLMDWNSVVNAGMGGQVFQDALKRTSEVMGTGAEAAIKKYGSFRESLTKGEWLTTEVLTETLKQFTMSAEEGTEQWENYKKSLMESGYTEKQATEILKMANTAQNAATKVKTFTQLWDTLKEAAQSGWTQSWEIVVGDFEEAKEMLTKVSDVIGEMINNQAKARNDMLQKWKDAGGRDDLLAAFSGMFEGIQNIAKPIKEAFDAIFPKSQEKKTWALVKFTMTLRKLGESFAEFTSKHGEQIRKTFEGIFSVIDIGWNILKDLGGGIVDIISNFTGLGGGLLDITASLGDWLSNLRDGYKETDFFGKGIDKVVGFISNAIDKLKEFGSSVKGYFNTPEFEGFVGTFQSIWEVIKHIGSAVGSVFSKIGKGISDVWGDTNIFDIINSFATSGMLVGLQALIWKFQGMFGGDGGIMGLLFGDQEGSLLDGLKETIGSVGDCFQAFQNQLNAETLKKIATAIAILAASLLVLSFIDGESMDRSLGAITIMFGELMGSLALLTKLAGPMKGAVKTTGLMIGLSTSLLILAGALKVISTMDGDQLGRGIVAIGALMAELALFLKFAKLDGDIGRTATGIVIISASLLIMAKAVKSFSEMSWDEIVRGLVGMAGALGAIVMAVNLIPNNWSAKINGFGSIKSTGNLVSAGIMFIAVAASMKIFASAMRDFAELKWDEVGKGLAGMAGSLLIVIAALKLMPKDIFGASSINMVGFGVGMIAVATALKILGSALSDFSAMSGEQIAKSLVVMAGSLLTLMIALNGMNGTLPGSAALLVAVGALALLAPIMKLLGGMTWEQIGKGLLTLAGAFVVIGVAGALLGPVVPTILALAAAFALFGVATLGIGAGLALISVGLAGLGTSLAVAATAIVAGLTIIVTGILDLLPTIVEKLADAIVALCQGIAQCAPQIAETILIVISEVLAALATYTPQIVESLMEFVIGVLNALAANLPDLIQAAVNVIGAFFEGIVNALSGIDTTSLLKGIVGVGLIAALMFALSGVVSLIPGAMVGVLGMGVVIAELALVLAAIGALAQIPGLHWLIAEGGNFLQAVGTAIGQFVGGIVGGIMGGVSNSFPTIATNLSEFMTNIQPFIEGAKQIDAAMLDGVKALAETILILTAANLLEGLTRWISGGSSISDFGSELGLLGTNLKEFATNLGDFDENTVTTVTCAANAVKALAEASKQLPNEGGWAAKILGDNSIATFGSYLPDLGSNLNAFAANLGTFNEDKVATVNSAVKAIESFASLAGTDLKGAKNNLPAFGEALPAFGTSVGVFCSNMPSGPVIDVVTANISKLVSTIKDIAASDPNTLLEFAQTLNAVGVQGVNKFIDAFTDTRALSNVKTSAKDMMGKVIEGIESKIKDLMTACKTVVASGAEAMKTKYQDFYDAGSYLVGGFAKGISENDYRAEAKARAMARAAADAAEDELDINSPSKVFRKIGSSVPEGFAMGIEKFGNVIGSSTGTMANTAVEGTRKAIARISSLIDGSIDAEPTIRPVLDLSSVRSGASELGGLFNQRASVGVLSNIGAINAMMDNRQNGNDDVISAIEKLSRDLSNIGGTTYNVNGITYDDGSNITEAIKILTRYALMERRT